MISLEKLLLLQLGLSLRDFWFPILFSPVLEDLMNSSDGHYQKLEQMHPYLGHLQYAGDQLIITA